MADYMVVASGASSRQVAAMAEHIEFKLKQNKIAILVKDKIFFKENYLVGEKVDLKWKITDAQCLEKT